MYVHCSLKNATLYFAVFGMLSSLVMGNPQKEKNFTNLVDEGMLRKYVTQFNEQDRVLYEHDIPNKEAFGFLKENIPLLECPDKNIERTYYYRWWLYRKHVKKTVDGFVITEFQPSVHWSGKHNTIACASGHHIYEGRWLHNNRIIEDYIRFWLSGKGEEYNYSTWFADSAYAYYLVTANEAFAKSNLKGLVENFKGWEEQRLGADGLFWQLDYKDGMENGIGKKHWGTRKGRRPSINSYMYGDAQAIARISEMTGDTKLAKQYRKRARELKKLILERLWDPEDHFFKQMHIENSSLLEGRELIGYCPWYFNLPPDGEGYAQAWRALMDPKVFKAPYGPTTAEQTDPEFGVPYTREGCQWNGPSWPFSTSFTLTALANLLNDYDQDEIDGRDFFDNLVTYARCHQVQRDDGSTTPYIGEELDPYTGAWVILTLGKEGIYKKRGDTRGKDYNHSTFCDLVISGLIGLRPRADDTVEVNPLVPEDAWRYFCLDNIAYHGHTLAILWDRTGKKYGKGKGLRVYADGKQVASAPKITRITVELPPVKK